MLIGICILAGCSVTRQRVDFTVRGDAPAAKPRGAEASLARKLTAGFRCSAEGWIDQGPEACLDVADRKDREIVGGDLGVMASVLPGVQCPAVCSRRVSVAPIAATLGGPPLPEQFARRLSPSSPTETSVRRAYENAIHDRYRRYADYVSRQIAGADFVEIAPMHGRSYTRYSGASVDYGVHVAFAEIARNYASLEWRRFERGLAPSSVATRESAPQPGGRRGKAAAPPADTPSPPEDAPAEPPEIAAPAVPAPSLPPSSAEKPPAPRPAAAQEASSGGGVGCRRTCHLRYRSCLARCRDRPITGGEYDACTYDCTGSASTCRAGCGAPATP